jgi:adenylosuccinate lyase
VKLHGRASDLLDRLHADPAFAKVDLQDMMNPSRFIGRSPQQVTRFVAEVIEPIRARYPNASGESAQLKV